MLTYEMFKRRVLEEFLGYLPKELQSRKLETKSMDKVNQRLDGFYLLPVNERDDKKPMPILYFNTMYEQYKEGEALSRVMQKAAGQMVEAIQDFPQSFKLDMENAKEHIVFSLVNTVQNEKLLQDVPHREFLDLSIVYRWIVGQSENGSDFYFSTIHHDFAETLGMSEAELYQAAFDNTKRLLSPSVVSMSEMFKEALIQDGLLPEVADRITDEMLEGNTEEMWVISNTNRVDGAASMLYEEKLHDLAERLGNDLYILPSSIHEVIAIPANSVKPEELAEMVSTINMDQVDLAERLSNQVYHYDKDTRELSLATDTPNKRLDFRQDEFRQQMYQRWEGSR